jgi:hypothetical protein
MPKSYHTLTRTSNFGAACTLKPGQAGRIPGSDTPTHNSNGAFEWEMALPDDYLLTPAYRSFEIAAKAGSAQTDVDDASPECFTLRFRDDCVFHRRRKLMALVLPLV